MWHFGLTFFWQPSYNFCIYDVFLIVYMSFKEGWDPRHYTSSFVLPINWVLHCPVFYYSHLLSCIVWQDNSWSIVLVIYTGLRHIVTKDKFMPWSQILFCGLSESLFPLRSLVFCQDLFCLLRGGVGVIILLG